MQMLKNKGLMEAIYLFFICRMIEVYYSIYLIYLIEESDLY